MKMFKWLLSFAALALMAAAPTPTKLMAINPSQDNSQTPTNSYVMLCYDSTSSNTNGIVVCPASTGGGGSSGNVTPGATFSSQPGPLTLGQVVTTSSSYTPNTIQPYNLTPQGMVKVQAFNQNGSAVALDGLGNTITVPYTAVPTACGVTTSATPGTATQAIPAATAHRHIMIQNTGTMPILFSFTAATSLSATNSYTLIAGEKWHNPATFVPIGPLDVASATASQTLMCEYN